VHYVELWAFETPPPDGLPWPPGSWPGATPLGRYLVVPDPVTRQTDLSVALPPGTTRVVVDRTPGDLYGGPLVGGQSFGLNVHPVTGGWWRFDFAWSCSP
jgi:hypothetical protein